jgi:hypothetical protein
LGHHKSRNPREIGTVHSGRDAWQQSEPPGKGRQEVIDRHLGHRDIGDPGDKVFVHFGIAKSETPMSGSQLSAYQRSGERHCVGQLSA